MLNSALALARRFIRPILELAGLVGIAVISISIDLSGAKCTGIADCFNWLGTWIGVVFIIVLCAAAYGQLGHWKATIDLHQAKKEIEELEAEISGNDGTILELRQNYLDLVRSHIANISSDLGYDNNERISIYIPQNNAFQLLSRYSLNPIFAQAARPIYPLQEGFIGRAWQEREYEIDGLPDPNLIIDVYIAAVRAQCNIPIGVIRRLRMKSRGYFCIAIRNARNQDHIAVLAFESIRVDQIDRQRISDLLNGSMGDALREMIERNMPTQPSLAYAAEEGL